MPRGPETEHAGRHTMKLKGIDQFQKCPLSKNEMEPLITNHMKEYVLANT